MDGRGKILGPAFLHGIRWDVVALSAAAILMLAVLIARP